MNLKTLTEPGQIVAKVGNRTELINTGNEPVFCFSNDAKDALATLQPITRQKVLSAKFAVQPGECLKLQAGSYNLEFSTGRNCQAVLLENA